MSLEHILSERSQIQEDKCCMMSFICGGIHRDRKWSNGYHWLREGEWGVIV